MKLETAMAWAWITASLFMVAHIVGAYLYGWSTNHVSWWVALVALVVAFVIESWTYWGGKA